MGTMQSIDVERELT